ncbi:MAG: hypothetical protein KIT09_17740 [Bryobacteraceae bacterium]|nr:hypothetical protein [Bryobacteraceae bacterium]
MRKTLIRDEPASRVTDTGPWLELEGLASVEITSEAPEHPIEAALGAAGGSGWRAAEAGPQRIKLLFDQPQTIRRVLLVFRETEVERTHEFTLSWTPEGDARPREIVRQQWNFSPGAASEEREEYHVELSGVKVLELRIVPNISGGNDRASLALLRVG